MSEKQFITSLAHLLCTSLDPIGQNGDLKEVATQFLILISRYS